MKYQRTTIAALSFLLGTLLFAPLVAFADDNSGGSDVVVKKNADGTVETSEGSGSGQAQSAGDGEPNVIYKLRKTPGTRKIDGVSVHTNPDGSIETTDDGGSGSSSAAPVHTSSVHHARSHSTSASRAPSKSKTAKKKTH